MLRVNENSIEEILREQKTVFILFNMLRCPFCMRFKPIFDKYSKSEKGAFAEAIIDDYENPLWDKYNIEYVPTVILFKDGKQIARKDSKSMMGLSEADMRDVLTYA